MLHTNHRNPEGVSIYKDLPDEAFVINAIGSALVGLGIMVPVLVGLRYFKSDKYDDELTAHL